MAVVRMSSKSKHKQRRREKARQRQNQRAQQNVPSPQPPSAVPPIQATNEVAEREKVADRANDQNGEKASNRRRLGNWIPNPSSRALFLADIFFAGAIAIAAWAQVYYGNKQWEATEKQWEVMVKQNNMAQSQINLMKLDVRPWLTINLPQLVSAIGDDREIVVHFPIENSGRLPAQITNHRIGLWLDVPSERHEDYSDEKISALIQQGDRLTDSSVAAPGGALVFIGRYIIADEDAEQLEEIRGARRILWSAGRIDYTDTTGAPYVTRFCFWYNIEKAKWEYHFAHSRME